MLVFLITRYLKAGACGDFQQHVACVKVTVVLLAPVAFILHGQTERRWRCSKNRGGGSFWNTENVI